MSDWSPPTVPRNWAIGIGLLYVLFLLYALLGVGNILLGVLPGFLILSSTSFGDSSSCWRQLRCLSSVSLRRKNKIEKSRKVDYRSSTNLRRVSSSVTTYRYTCVK